MSAASTPGQVTASTPGNTPLASKPARILACVLCQHRKIKCDRTFPCANCVKANVTCTPSTPAPARKRRRPNQDLQERLARCEELLKAYATAKPEGEGGPSGSLIGNGGDECKSMWRPPGRLIVGDDGNVNFVESIMLGSIYEELKAMREIIDGDDSDDITPDTTAVPPDENADMVLCGSGDQASDVPRPGKATIESLMPPPAIVFRLWQMYLERVNPLTKIIHVPTLQPFVVEATTGGHNVPLNIRALLFAIYTLATVSMTQDECLNFLGYSRDAALSRFSEGVRLCLVRIGFLKAYDLETLQTLVIYLISLQGRYNRHSAWILNGIVLRIAQKMGLHRDGEKLGLSPFDTEMRRRVWWQIIMVDAKYALMSGLSHSMLPHFWDTKEPNNVNDADLFPSATEPVQSREGPTEMIMVMLTNRVARFLMETPGIEPMFLFAETEAFKLADGPSHEQIAVYRQMIGNLGQTLLDIIDKYCDPTAGPLHEMALDIKTEIISKIETILLPPKEGSTAGDEMKSTADNVFRIAVKSIEHECLHYTQTKNKGFAWFSRLDFQVNIFLFVVGQLCTRTSGKLVELAWEAVQTTYENFEDLFDISSRVNQQVAMFVLKAWRTRKVVLREQLKGLTPETPNFILRLQSLMPLTDDFKTEPRPGSSSVASTIIQPSVGAMSPISEDKMPFAPDPVLDQFMAQPFFDPNSIDWDMWGSVMPTESVVSAFDGMNTYGNPSGSQQW